MEEERSVKRNVNVSNNRCRYQVNSCNNSSNTHNSSHITSTDPTNLLTSIVGPMVGATIMAQDAGHQQTDTNLLQHSKTK
eukprot:3685615-Ditylum_brightwellii.AAC.1